MVGVDAFADFARVRGRGSGLEPRICRPSASGFGLEKGWVGLLEVCVNVEWRLLVDVAAALLARRNSGLGATADSSESICRPASRMLIGSYEYCTVPT